ncbi:MAG: ankyrin repeat domain-containing protein [Phycisphaerae bacterium]|nr:ankyrin repeat domain-containing protein [Phycisphaerae bacterium]MDD5381998.1 ankyrin repeat domain-containing protein [Phycisphaerae bacterium]
MRRVLFSAVCVFIVLLVFAGTGTPVMLQAAESTDVNSASFAMHKAVYEGNLEEVKALIAKGADVNAKWPKDINGAPLHFAAIKGDENILMWFGGEVRDKIKKADHPGLYKEIVSLLLAKGADVNAKMSGGWTPLHFAVKLDDLDIVEMLIVKGADVDAKNSSGITPLLFAIGDNHEDMKNLLLTKGAKVDIVSASAMGDTERVKVFLEEDPNMINAAQGNFMPLHIAALNGQTETVKFLLEKGADVNGGYPTKPTPLYWAALKGHLDIAELLINKGAGISNESFGFPHPLFGAIAGKHKEAAELLIAKGAGVNFKSKNTPLLMAMGENCPDIAELLIAKGADVNAKDRDDKTPLHYAASGGNKDIVEMLLARGADINAKGKDGETPPVLAERKGYPDIAEFMRKYQAQSEAEKSDTNEPGSSNNITFKSAEPAPEAFDAWSFRWMGPVGEPNAKFWYVVIQPDGKEYFRYDLPILARGRLRSDFGVGIAGGDPSVFYKEYIHFSVFASKGKPAFSQSDSAGFKFEFYQKNAEGKIEWKKPFKTIDSVIDSSADAEVKD